METKEVTTRVDIRVGYDLPMKFIKFSSTVSNSEYPGIAIAMYTAVATAVHINRGTR
jgi:hypothetical protein